MNVRSLAARNIFAFIAMSIPLLVSGVARSQEILSAGYFDIPPHVIGVEGGVPKGAAISYFEEYIAPHLGITIKWDTESTPPTRLMNQLRNGEKDAMIFLGKTEERTEYLRYPNPYLIIPETLAFKNEHPINTIREVGDLHGLTVGFLVGGRIPDPLRDNKIRYDLIAGKRLFERNVEKLLLGRIDAIYAPLSTALANIIGEMGVSDQIKLVPIEFLEQVKIYTVFSKKTISKDFVEIYNKALEAANREITYIDYIEIYLSRTDTN